MLKKDTSVYSELLGSINYDLINQIKQEEYSLASAFNNSGSMMISGCNQDVKVWQFQKGKLILLNLLKGQGKYISCLLFSKKEQWFISGNDEGLIQCWKKGSNNYEWIRNQASNKHSNFINCIILSKNEDQLISCSSDKNIFVWSTKFETNQINFEYSLQNKHTSDVQRIYFKSMIYFLKHLFKIVLNEFALKLSLMIVLAISGLSLNPSETLLVSCSIDQLLILWTKAMNGPWTYFSSVKQEKGIVRVFFFNDSQILVQQGNGSQFISVFQIVNSELKQQNNLRIQLKSTNQNQDSVLFPIIQKSHQYVYVIRKQRNGQFKIEAQPIDCETIKNYGTMTEDGEYLVIWNDKTKQYRIYKFNYE